MKFSPPHIKDYTRRMILALALEHVFPKRIIAAFALTLTLLS
jgi:hypothetical protein